MHVRDVHRTRANTGIWDQAHAEQWSGNMSGNRNTGPECTLTSELRLFTPSQSTVVHAKRETRERGKDVSRGPGARSSVTCLVNVVLVARLARARRTVTPPHSHVGVGVRRSPTRRPHTAQPLRLTEAARAVHPLVHAHATSQLTHTRVTCRSSFARDANVPASCPPD